MKLGDILAITENGTVITVYDSNKDKVLTSGRLGSTYTTRVYKKYGDMKVIGINTSSDDDDIELVVK